MNFEALQEICNYTTLLREDWHQHSNGKGWVHKDVKILCKDEEVYVGPKAIVFSGVMRGGEMRGGVMHGGEMHGGEMHGGEMHGGVMWGGVMRGGEMRGGVMHGGVMRGGEMHGGEMHGGEMHGGVMWGGVMRGGEMRGGVMRGGEMHGGVMHGGVMRGGEMHGGVMWGGVWKTTPLFIAGSRHPLSNAKHGHLQIGCKCEPFAWWKTEKAAKFARDNGYSKEEQTEYAAYIELFIKFGK